MDREALKERIKFYTEMVKLGTAVSIAVGGGSVGLLLIFGGLHGLLVFGSP